MARKKSRNVDGCAETNDSPEKYDSKGNCPHIVKGVDIAGLKKAWKKTEDVICQDCKKKQMSTAKKTAGVENDIWVCMNCGHVGCGNAHHDHGMDHFHTPHSDCHSVVAVIDTWTLRCLQCRLDINLEVNAKASDAIAYLKKNFNLQEPREENSAPNNMGRKIINTASIVPEAKYKSKTAKELKIYPILGLENLGNTCYLNTILQCLAQTPSFVKSLESCCQNKLVFQLLDHEKLINDNGDHLPPLEGILGEGGQLTKAVFRVLHRIRCGARLRKTGVSTENPGDVIRLMKKLSNTFYVGEQHDSHELLRFLLEGLRSEDLKRHQRGILSAMNICPSSKEVLPQQREFLLAYKDLALKNNLVTEQIFGGSFVSILKCLECNLMTTTFESFMDISLPVESEKGIQVKSVEKLNMEAEMRSISKHQQKKERKMARRTKKKSRMVKMSIELPSAQPVPKPGHSSNESGTESEADVEDNADTEITTDTTPDDESKTESSLETSPMVLNKYQDNNLSYGQADYKEFSDDNEKLNPYTLMLHGFNQHGHEEPGVGITTVLNEQNMCGHSASQEIGLIGSCYSPEPSRLTYGCDEEHPTIPYASGSPEHSENEDFGSCEGGRGSPASSIEQADWDEEEVALKTDEDEKKENMPMTPECILVQEIQKGLQITGEQESTDVPPSEPFEFLSGEGVKTEDPALHDFLSTYNVNVLYENIPTVSPIPRIAPHFSVTDDKEMFNVKLSHEANHMCNMPEVDIKAIPDEAIESVVDEVGQSELEKLEGADNGLLPNNLSYSVDQSGGMTGGVWGTTLAPPSELESAPYSLEHCLRKFFNEEVLSGSNRIGCEGCTQRMEGREPNGDDKLVQTSALKQLLFLKLPEVLTIHLKRFEVIGSRMSKITRKVTFPFELDVSPYTSAKIEAKQPDVLPCYQLYAVIEHSGHLSSGHYVAYVKVPEEITDQLEPVYAPEKCTKSGCQENNPSAVVNSEFNPNMTNDITSKWYYISDTFVKETSLKEVMDAEAYILFYGRI